MTITEFIKRYIDQKDGTAYTAAGCEFLDWMVPALRQDPGLKVEKLYMCWLATKATTCFGYMTHKQIPWETLDERCKECIKTAYNLTKVGFEAGMDN